MKNAIHISSFDVDGCLLGEKFNSSTHETLKTALQQQNTLFKVNIGMVGSNRQDKALDDCNRGDRTVEEASAFKILPTFFSELGIQFDPVLLADIYAQQAQGQAFKNSTLPIGTYHARYVFDELKSSLLYFQIHQAALNARACDFIILDQRPSDLGTVRKRSNAAFVYCRDTKELFYLNTMEDKVEQCAEKDLQDLITVYESPEILGKRDCFEQGDCFGFRLNDEELKKLGQHVTKDYPIYFDFYDDRTDILQHLETLFRQHPNLLPAQVVLRLHCYNIERPYTTQHLMHLNTQCIQGQGGIDLNPGQTLRQFATATIGYRPEGFDYNGFSLETFSQAMLIPEHQQLILNNPRAVSEPVQVDSQYGLIQDCAPIKVRLIQFQSQLRSSWFLSNSQLVTEQQGAIQALIQCLDNPGEKFLSPEQIPVLQQGRLGKILKDKDINLDDHTQKPKGPYDACLFEYKTKRQQRGVSPYLHSFWGGCSKSEKFDAVNLILLATANGAQPIELSPRHQKALTQGQLAKTLKDNKIQVSFVDDRAYALKCLSSNPFNLSVKIKKTQKISELLGAELTPSARAAGLILAFALSTQSRWGFEKSFGETHSMHRFCLELLKPNTFSQALREAVFDLANLSAEERSNLSSTQSEFLRQKLIANMENIFQKAKPVLGLSEVLVYDEKINQSVGQALRFRPQ